MGDLLELVNMIYDAALDPSRWQLFLDALIAAIGGMHCFMVVHAEGAGQTALFWSSNSPKEAFTLLATRPPGEWYGAAGNGWPEGAIRKIHEICLSPPDSRAEPGKFASPKEVHCGLMGVFLRTREGASVIVALRLRSEGPFDGAASSLLGSLMAHLKRAALLQSELVSLHSQLSVFNIYLDRHPHPILLIDTRAHILYANAAANNIASLNDGLRIVKGHISLTSAEEQLAFIKAVTEAASRDSCSVRWLQVTRATEGRPYHLMLMPVHSNGHSDAQLGNVLEAGVVLVAPIVNREPVPEPDPAILCVLFSLTQTEARVAAKLATGLSAKEIAAEMRVSLETVRTHIRRVLSKTSTGRQGELISLILRSTPLRHL